MRCPLESSTAQPARAASHAVGPRRRKLELVLRTGQRRSRRENCNRVSACCFKMGKEDVGGTSTGRGRGFRSLMGDDEMVLGFLKTSERASWENVAGHGSNTQLWLQRHLCHRGCQLRGAREGGCPGAITTQAY